LRHRATGLFSKQCKEIPVAIRALVWGENVHETKNKVVGANYPKGMHARIAEALGEDKNITASTATLQEAEHGLTEAKLKDTDVLLWWGHAAHGQVDDAIVERVAKRVWEGMGLIVLHSGHFSKIFKRLMGSPCALNWREAGERERIWVVNPGHPIAAGLPQYFELEMEEMYGEPFTVPEPLETVFIGWFQGGEVFRSGLTYRRGAGNIFYFQPGHETYPTYHDANVHKVLRNAVNWAYNPTAQAININSAPNRPVDKAPEKITARGPSLHAPGEEGLR
jgi:trehalose utilization protein